MLNSSRKPWSPLRTCLPCGAKFAGSSIGLPSAQIDAVVVHEYDHLAPSGQSTLRLSRSSSAMISPPSQPVCQPSGLPSCWRTSSTQLSAGTTCESPSKAASYIGVSVIVIVVRLCMQNSCHSSTLRQHSSCFFTFSVHSSTFYSASKAQFFAEAKRRKIAMPPPVCRRSVCQWRRMQRVGDRGRRQVGWRGGEVGQGDKVARGAFVHANATIRPYTRDAFNHDFILLT